jgi:hypothetical protein
MCDRPQWIVSLLFIVSLWAPATSARAQPKIVGSFEEVVADAAAEVLKRTGNQPVSVGEFTRTGLRNTNSGPPIADLLEKALLKINPGSVKPDADFEVKGDYSLQEVDREQDRKKTGAGVVRLSDFVPNHLQVIAIKFRIIPLKGGEEDRIPITRFVDDNRAIGRILQISGPVETGDGGSLDQQIKRNKRIAELAKKSECFVDPSAPTIVKSVKESPYSIEILAEPLSEHLAHQDEQSKHNPTEQSKHHPTPLPATIDPKSGLAFVDIPEKFIYEIRAFNASGQEAAIAVNIDGLNIFQFSEDVDKSTGAPLYNYLVFDKRTTVVGWHKSVAGKRFDRFLVTEYGKGASSQTGRPASGRTGVIQVAFSRSGPLPKDSRGRGGKETGFGPPEHVDQAPVERKISDAVDYVTVRYTRPNND